MPNNKSTWPAFWMSPNVKRYGDGWPMNGEIDIVETKGSDLDYAAADAHWGKSVTNKTQQEQPQIGTYRQAFQILLTGIHME